MGKILIPVVALFLGLTAAYAEDTNKSQCLNAVEKSMQALEAPARQIGPKCPPGDFACVNLGKLTSKQDALQHDRLKKDCLPMVRAKCDTYAQYVGALGLDQAWSTVMNNCSAGAIYPAPELVSCACQPVDQAALDALISKSGHR